ncbi:MAG: hypothetical protein ACQKBT_11135 [Puniceicoccales bacterium]
MKTQRDRICDGAKRSMVCLSRCCAYHHLLQVVRVLVKGGDISDLTRTGRTIALLGFFCPIFWIALLSGADASTIALHAGHSGIVFLIGLAIMVFSLFSQKP